MALDPFPVIRLFFLLTDSKTFGYYQTGFVASHSHSSDAIFATDVAACTAESPSSTFVPPNLCCYPHAPAVFDSAEAAAFDIATLGLVPPFHVEGP